ncbi:hypothetical protein NW759_014997 [Fusarium solani]|nr:hypothetical protein NW759_014997 [Fusarium solani]
MPGFREVFALPKEVVRQATPLGTAQLYREGQSAGEDSAASDELRLVPTPSKDPADPLNWPKWRKLMTLCCVAMFSFSGNMASASLTSALPFYASEFSPPLGQTKQVRLIAVCALMLGVANIILVPLANIFGRRAIVLLSLATLTACSAWAATATSYSSFLAARAMQGVGGAATETLCPTVIGEVFFRHQRGRAMAVYTIFLTASSFLGGVIGGYIADTAGWRWTQWLNVITAGASFVAAFLFQAETLWTREQAPTTEPTCQSDAEPANHDPGQDKAEFRHQEDIDAEQYRDFTFVRALRIGLYRGNIMRHLVAPWLTLRFPGVWLVMLQYGCMVGAIVTVATIGPQFMSLPPYNWGSSAGLINVGALVGTLLGLVITYTISDWALQRHAHRQQHKLSEPESRLPGMLPGFFFATAALWIFGFVGDHPSENGWVGLQVGYGLLGVGLIIVPSIGLTYLIEAYGPISSDALVMVAVVRSVIGFTWTFFVGNWLQDAGSSQPFGIFGMLMAIFGLLTIPMWLYGKRLRMVTEKWLPRHGGHRSWE